MKFRIRIDPRLATVLAISLAFAAAASIMFIQMLGLMSGQVNLARFMWAIPVLGMGAVGALTWWVVFPRWLETKRVQKVVREVTGAGQADIDLERARTWKHSQRLRYAWFGGMAASIGVALLLHSSTVDAPLWAPLAIVTVLAQMNTRQTVQERARTLVVCALLLFIFGGIGRNLLSSGEGSLLLVAALFGVICWHYWEQRRGLVEMQNMVREARYEQAIAKAELSPSTFAPALKAYALFRKGDTEAAKLGLRVALAKAVDSSKAAFALAKYGELLLAEGQIDGAIAPVEGALKLRPEEGRAHRVMAQIFLEQIDSVRLGRSRRQSDADQQAKLLALAQSGKPEARGKDALIESALAHARKSAEAVPRRGADLAVLAWAQAAAGKQDDAQETVQQAAQAITDQLDVAEGRYFLGRAYGVMGQPDWSRSCFEAVKGAESRGHYRTLAERALADLAAKVNKETAVADLQSLTEGVSGEPASTPSESTRR